MISIKRFFRAKPTAEEKDTLLSAYMTHLQRRAADYLNARTKRFTTTQLKIMLITFCVVAGSYCCYLAFKSLVYGNGPPVSQHSIYGMEAIPPGRKSKK